MVLQAFFAWRMRLFVFEYALGHVVHLQGELVLLFDGGLQLRVVLIQ